jgi:hypothetical protein
MKNSVEKLSQFREYREVKTKQQIILKPSEVPLQIILYPSRPPPAHLNLVRLM